MRIGQGGAAQKDQINQFLTDDSIGNGRDAQMAAAMVAAMAAAMAEMVAAMAVTIVTVPRRAGISAMAATAAGKQWW